MSKQKRKLTSKENLFKMSLRLGGIHAPDSTLVHTLKIWEKTKEKGDEFSMKDSIEIELEMEDLYPPDGVDAETQKETETAVNETTEAV